MRTLGTESLRRSPETSTTWEGGDGALSEAGVSLTGMKVAYSACVTDNEKEATIIRKQPYTILNPQIQSSRIDSTIPE